MKPLHEAALELGVSPKRLRRLIRAGAPVARLGGRGRGRSTLIDVPAVRAWLAGGDDARLLSIASALPEIVADAMLETFVRLDGPHKRPCAGVLAAAGYRAIAALLDRIRDDVPAVPELSELPDKIDRLRAICRDYARMATVVTTGHEDARPNIPSRYPPRS